MSRIRRHRLRVIAASAGVLALAMVAAACGSSGSGSQRSAPARADTDATVTFAESPGAPPDYIFPLDALQYFDVSNIYQFQDLMWRPLYWFGRGNDVTLDTSRSLADAPVYSDGNKVVSITLKPWDWSDGKPVTARDVTFWINLLRANKEDWGEYAPGYFPDDVSSVATKGTSTVVLHLNGAVSPTWFTLNELSQITPLPQHSWDRTSASGPIGNYDETAKGAGAVYAFLNKQSMQLSSYATNPLWQVVDGPWKLTKFDSDGYAVFAPNRAYSGTKPRIAKFVEEPFASESAEYDLLRSGGLTYGYVPISDIAEKALLKTEGYQVQPWFLWSMNIIPMNFHNPTQGPLYDQAYIRQAMQHLIDEPQLSKAVLDGYSITDNGPVPNGPSRRYVTSTVEKGPLGYSTATATTLLSEHGWTMGSGGVRVCSRPGTGPTDCGTGIAAGAPLRFTLLYAAGVTTIDDEVQALKSSFSQAGIDVALTEAPASQVYASAVPCTAKQAACKWGMAYWGNGWQFAPDNYPSGEVAFATGAVGNFGSYSNAEMDTLIKATTTKPGLTPLDTWENYTAGQVPMLFMPVSPYQVSAISSKLHGALPQPVDGLAITPEQWSVHG